MLVSSSGGAGSDASDQVPVSAIPSHGLLGVKLANGDRVVVIQRGGVITVLADECPHHAMPLSSGLIGGDGTVECPWHGARFDSQTGRCVRGPATDDVPVYDASVTDGTISIGGRRS